jgi:hypothetical protein
MPLFRDMTDDQKFRVMSRLDAKLTAIMETRVKLRARRNSVILSSEEDFEVETQLLRLDQQAGDIVEYKEALSASEEKLRAPTQAELQEMLRRIQEIRSINVTNSTASAIITTATEIIGEVPKKK